MTVEEMLTLYYTKMGPGEVSSPGPFTVRVWDGMDGCWCDVVANVDRETALRTWCKETSNGTHAASYNDIDYYRIFLATTQMLWSGNHTMRGDDE